jgi:hypothetical protein
LEAGSRWKVIAVLACSALTRETALLVIGAYSLFLFTRRRFADGAWVAATAAPAAAWYLYLSHRAGPSALLSYVAWTPLVGLVDRIFRPAIYSLPTIKNVVAIAFDYAALSGIVVTLVIAARLALKRRWDAGASAIYALAIAALFVQSRDVWQDAFAFGRVLTPLMLLMAIRYLSPRPWLALVPMFLVDARLCLDLWSQIAGVVRGFVK